VIVVAALVVAAGIGVGVWALTRTEPQDEASEEVSEETDPTPVDSQSKTPDESPTLSADTPYKRVGSAELGFIDVPTSWYDTEEAGLEPSQLEDGMLMWFGNGPSATLMTTAGSFESNATGNSPLGTVEAGYAHPSGVASELVVGVLADMDVYYLLLDAGNGGCVTLMIMAPESTPDEVSRHILDSWKLAS
jgi:hypothetical protein